MYLIFDEGSCRYTYIHVGELRLFLKSQIISLGSPMRIVSLNCDFSELDNICTNEGRPNNLVKLYCTFLCIAFYKIHFSNSKVLQKHTERNSKHPSYRQNIYEDLFPFYPDTQLPPLISYINSTSTQRVKDVTHLCKQTAQSLKNRCPWNQWLSRING